MTLLLLVVSCSNPKSINNYKGAIIHNIYKNNKHPFTQYYITIEIQKDGKFYIKDIEITQYCSSLYNIGDTIK